MELIYGKNSVETYLEYAPYLVKKVYLQSGLQEKTMEHLDGLIVRNHIDSQELNKHQFGEVTRKLDRYAVHQGIVAEVESFKYQQLDAILAKTLKKDKVPFFLILDEVQDPRNLGAILRTADCAGHLDGVIIPKHRSASVTAAAIKTSTGAALNIPIIQVTNIRQAIQKLKAAEIWVCALNMDGAKHYREERFDMPLAIVVGGEDTGIRDIVAKEVDFNVYIPMQSKTVNSLNVSVATSLLLYEVAHQRSLNE